MIRFNRACERLTGYTFEEVEGRPFFEIFIEPDEVEPIRRALQRVWAGDFPADNENHWLLRDGSRRLIAWSNTALLTERGDVEFIVASGYDITERKRAEAEIRASRSRILEAQDTARRRLERNLHDGAQQRLVALALALRIAQSRAKADPETVERMLAEAGEELIQATAELRELARGIHPAVLTDRGLSAALDALAGRSPTPCAVEVTLEERLPRARRGRRLLRRLRGARQRCEVRGSQLGDGERLEARTGSRSSGSPTTASAARTRRRLRAARPRGPRGGARRAPPGVEPAGPRNADPRRDPAGSRRHLSLDDVGWAR